MERLLKNRFTRVVTFCFNQILAKVGKISKLFSSLEIFNLYVRFQEASTSSLKKMVLEEMGTSGGLDTADQCSSGIRS